jgi:hypothetical protein
MDHPRPWLRYVNADDLEEADVRFDEFDVKSPSGDKLGDVDGFVVDADRGRPQYVVVDSGGWFKSKHFLLPVGHLRFDPSRKTFVADLTRDRIQRFPGFDKDRFDTISDEELDRIDVDTAAVCCPDETMSADTVRGERWSHSRQPDWWKSSYYAPGTTTRTSPTRSAGAAPVSERPDRERIVAREIEDSPHFDGRAQPGDVIGFETGGEQTHIGETSQDENERRRKAERTVDKKRK